MKKIFLVLTVFLGILNFSFACLPISEQDYYENYKQFTKKQIKEFIDYQTQRQEYKLSIKIGECEKQGGKIDYTSECRDDIVCLGEKDNNIKLDNDKIEKISYEKYPKIDIEKEIENLEQLKLNSQSSQSKGFLQTQFRLDPDSGPASEPISIQYIILKFIGFSLFGILIGAGIIYMIVKKYQYYKNKKLK